MIHNLSACLTVWSSIGRSLKFILIEIKVLKDEKRKLEAYIEAMKEEQLESRSQVEDLQEKLADQYEQYRDQVRSLIISQVRSS